MEELWFGLQASGKQVDGNSSIHKRQQLSAVSVIMGVCGNFKDRQSPLDDLLSKISSSKAESESSSLHNQFAELVDAMIDGLIDASATVHSVCRLGKSDFYQN